jgi:hypothetical protein
MTRGTAFLRLKEPTATMPTTIEVVADELWTMLVARIPMKRPTKGLLVDSMSVFEKPVPKLLNVVPRRVMLRRNR